MRMRDGIVVLGAAVAGAWAVYGAAPAAQADRPAEWTTSLGAAIVGDATPVEVVPMEAVSAGASSEAAGARPHGRRQGAVPVTTEDFEGDDFPPEGWQTTDLRTQEGQQENYTWGNQDVLLAAPAQGRPGGGLKAPWAIGGGRLGANLSPGSNYDQPLASVLTYGPFDASDFDGGVQVDFMVYLDGPINPDPNVPVVTSFAVCATTPDPTSLRCSFLRYQAGDGSDLRRRWLTLSAPIQFPATANLTAVRIYFRAIDLTPTGQHTGSLIDNVTIEGLSSSVPTDTPEPGVTPPTARPNDTPESSPTPFVATPDGSSQVYLPIAVNNIDKDIMAPSQPTALPGKVEVAFGVNVLPDSTLVGQGTRFGRIFKLCSTQRWSELPVDTVLSVQWYDYDTVLGDWQKLTLAEDNERLNPTTRTTATTGVLRECVESGDGQAIAPGRFRVAVFLRGESVAWADEVAEVAAPQPTAVPTLPSNCQNPVVNGDFELGGTGWRGSARDSHNLLVSPGFDSRIAIGLAGYDNALDSIESTGQIETLPLEDIESVTIRFALGLVGNETRGNGDNADQFIIGVAGETPQDAEGIALSEDSIVSGQLLPLGRWVPLSVDMKDLWAKREHFGTAHIFFGATTNASNPMAFVLDNVAVEYCRKSGEVVRVPVRWTPGAIAPEALAAALESARSAAPTLVRRDPAPRSDRPLLPFHPAGGR